MTWIPPCITFIPPNSKTDKWRTMTNATRGVTLASTSTLDRLPPVRTIGRERQLFVDDYHIAIMDNVSRFIHQPAKREDNPVFVMAEPWEGKRFIYCDVVYDRTDKIYKLWYAVVPQTPADMCYAVSKDGIHFERPKLGLVDYKGSTDNNLVRLPEGFNHDKTVLKDDHDEDEQRRYKMIHYTTGGVGVAFSPDGLTWTANDANPVLSPTGDGSQWAFWDDRIGRYVMYVRPNGRHVMRHWPKKGVPYDASAFPTRRIGRSESIDFLNWTDIEEVISPDERDGDGTEFYYMRVLPYEGCYIGFLTVYHEFTGDERIMEGFNYGLDVQLTFSRDGRDWIRVGNRHLFMVGTLNTWDEKRIYLDDAIVQDEEIWLYYRGSNIPHAGIGDLMGTERNGQKLMGDALGMATLRLDGFASICAYEEEGSLTTNPFHFEGDELRINANAAKGAIQVEALTLYGEPIAGLARADCETISADGLDHVVRWESGQKFGGQSGPLRLRFHMKDARLYSFRVS